MSSVTSAVDDFMDRVPPEQRPALERLRRSIRSAVPEAEEAIRSGVPAFRYNDTPLVSIGAAKNHLSLFIMYDDVLKTYRDELEAFDTSNTVVRFQPQKPLPARLITKLVKARQAEIEGEH
jgi:uncharacterized protein YdhG (YjbR/CyaY superfamily)